jgi:hypothetical protein
VQKSQRSPSLLPSQELIPGDRVEGLGNFGKPTGEFGTMERANEDNAVVKWDDDGRMRLHQPSLKKVWPATIAPLGQVGNPGMLKVF